MADSGAATRLTDEQLVAMLDLVKDADSVELKVTVPEAGHRSSVRALGIDPLDAQIRQVFFFDTPDLALDRAGVVVRARRIQGKGDDSVVKLRPVVPAELPAEIRRSPSFNVEVDAMPGGYVCSASLKGRPAPGDVKRARRGRGAAPEALLEGAAGVLRGARAGRDRSSRTSRCSARSSSSRSPGSPRASGAGSSPRCGSTRTASGSWSSPPSACPREALHGRRRRRGSS